MMTRDQVVQKWDKKHHTALLAVLRFTDNDERIILLPKRDYRRLVTTQIFKELGFYYAGPVYYYTQFPKTPKKELIAYKYIRNDDCK